MLLSTKERQRKPNPTCLWPCPPPSEESDTVTILPNSNSFIHKLIQRLLSPIVSQEKEKGSAKVSTLKLKTNVWGQLTQQRSGFSKTKAGGDKGLCQHTPNKRTSNTLQKQPARESCPGNSFLKG